MATRSFPPELNQGTDAIHLELDEFPNNVEVNIAIIGKSGSGRSSFVRAILGLNEGNNEKPTSYYHPEHPNVKFSIHPIMDAETPISFENHLESLNTETFDTFLFFTDDKFTKNHGMIAKKVRLGKKPLIFVRTKCDNKDDPETFGKVRAILREMIKQEHSKELDSHECKIWPISNRHPFEINFLKFTKAIADALIPSGKMLSFCQIPRVKELIALEKFNSFLKDDKEQAKQKHILPSMDEIKNLLQSGGIVGIQQAMNQKLDRWTKVRINLAILGESGVGKSSFINAIRGVDDSDENAAVTGVTESTMVPTKYEHPTNPNIHFWDVPGLGSPKCHDFSAYCEKIRIEIYDTFLILCSQRFLNDDLKLAAKVKSMGKSFFFIRTKIDNDKRCEMRRLGRRFDEVRMLEMIRNDCAQNLRTVETFDESEEQIFLISSWEPTNWDFERLKKAILDQLPTKQKEALSLSMRITSEAILNQKIKTIKDKLWPVALLSVFCKITLGPLGFSVFIDGSLIRSKVKDFSNLLQLPRIDSEDFKGLSEDLQEKMRKFETKPNEDLLEWLKSFDPDNMLDLRMAGKLILTKKPFHFVFRILNLILDEMEEIALNILCRSAVGPGDEPSSSNGSFTSFVKSET